MKSIGEGIWIAERPFRLFGAEFGNRMTIIRLANEQLLVHSPIVLDDGIKAEIENLGYVAHIVTPNAFHGLFVQEWMIAFPRARHFTAKQVERNQPFPSTPLSGSVAEEWKPTLDMGAVGGIPKLNEFVFFHAGSRTLILTDLAFNIGGEASLWTRAFFTLNNAYGKFGPSRLLRSMIEDCAALKASLIKILEWDFEQIVVSHGDIVQAHGKERMRQAFQDYLISLSDTKHLAPFRSSIRCG